VYFTSTSSTMGSATRICHAVFLTHLVATLWRYTDVVSLEGFTPHITLHAGVGTVRAGSPTLWNPAVLLPDQSPRFGSHANVIRRSRLSPNVAGRANVERLVTGPRWWRQTGVGIGI
jgi:hypothetical protein